MQWLQIEKRSSSKPLCILQRAFVRTRLYLKIPNEMNEWCLQQPSIDVDDIDCIKYFPAILYEIKVFW